MLLLYITSDKNMGLLDKPCNENNIVVKQMNGSFDLQQFIISDISNLSCCQYLAIDLSCLNDVNDDLINAIVGIKSMYDFRIIVLASGYETHNPILGRIFAEGIYNIITDTRQNKIQEMIRKCLDDGMQYKDSIKYRLQSDYIPSQNHSKKKQPHSKVIIQKQSIKQTISVGVSGALHRIGTTKQALHITKFLCENGYRACYIENNGHGHVETFVDFYDVQGHDNYFTYNEIDIYPTFDMASILQGGYDFLVYDNGLFDETDKQKFLEFDFKIICAGANAWEAPHINPIFSEIGEYSDIHFIFSLVPVDVQKDILNYMGKFKSKTYFAKYATSVIECTVNSKIYKRIFNDYIHEKSQVMQAKKGFWKR